MSSGEPESDRFDDVRRIYLEAIDLPLAERAAFVDQACSDASVRREVHELLAEGPDSGNGSAPFAAVLREGITAAFEEDSTDRWLVGTQVGRYRIDRRIAHGGMGSVFEAEQEDPKRRVALKVIRPSRIDDTARRRFKIEVAALARLDHVGIARVFEAGVHQDPALGPIPYFAMEFVEGADPITIHCASRKLPTSDRMRLVASVCDAVQHAHQKGIIHRDLKPSNILIDAEGHPKVIDFGIARALDSEPSVGVTLTGQTPGTPEFMSPEQCLEGSGAIDTRTDVYALGVVLFAVLAEKLPHDFPRGCTDGAKIRVITDTEPRRLASVNPAFRGDIDAIVGKALSREPAGRYQTVADFAADIRRHLGSEPIVARPLGIFGRAVRFTRRRPWQVGSAVAGLAVIVAVTLWLIGRVQFAELEKEQERSRVLAYGRQNAAVNEALQTNAFDRARAILKAAPEGPSRFERRHLLARLETALFHRDLGRRASNVAFSPDGRLLAIMTDDREHAIQLLETGDDATDWRELPPILTPSGGAMVRFSPEGDYLVALMYDSRVMIWDVRTPSSPRLAHDWKSKQVAMALSVDPRRGQRLIAVGSRAHDRSGVEIHDFEGRLVGELSFEKLADISNLAFSPDGKRLGVALHDWTVRLVDVANPARPVAGPVLRGHTYLVDAIAWGRDSRWIASGSSDRTIRIWDVERSEAAFRERGAEFPGELLAILTGHEANVLALTTLADGSLVSGSVDSTVRVWDVTEDFPLEYPADSVFPRKIWKVPRFLERLRLAGSEGWVRSVAGSPDGRFIASCGWTGSGSGQLRIWARDPGPAVPTLRGHRSSVYAVAFRPDGQVFASVAADFTLRLWDVLTCRELSVVRGPDIFRSCAWHPGGRSIVVGSDDESLRLWDVGDPTRPRFLQLIREKRRAVGNAPLSVAMSPKGTAFAAGRQDGTVELWRLDDAGTHAELARDFAPGSLPVLCVAFSPEGEHLALGYGRPSGFDPPADVPGEVVLIDPIGGVVTRRMPAPSAVTCIAFEPTGSRLAAGTRSGKLLMWELGSSAGVARSVDAHTADVTAIAWHPTEPRLATASCDRLIKFWDTDSLIEVAPLSGHSGFVAGLMFSPDGSRLASASTGSFGDDNVVKLWETDVPVRQKLERAAWTEVIAIGRRAAQEEESLARLDEELGARSFTETMKREARKTWAMARARRLVRPSVLDPRLTRAEAATLALAAAQAEALSPADPEAVIILGAARYREGRFSEATDLLMRAHDLFMERHGMRDPLTAGFLALAWLGLSDVEKCRQWREQAGPVVPRSTDDAYTVPLILTKEIDDLLESRGAATRR